MTNLDINDNNFLRQFEVNIGGQLAKVEYALQERKIFLTKIILPENTSDEFKEEFLVQIFEIIKGRKLRMMPTSSEIKKFLKWAESQSKDKFITRRTNQKKSYNTSTNRIHYFNVYDDDMINMVGDLYKEDIDYLNYSFEE